MEDHPETSFIFEIDNYSEKATISSPIFTSGRCKWFVRVFPQRHSNRNYVYMYLAVSNSISLRSGWERKAFYTFIIWNESGKELQRASAFNLFSNEVLPWYYPEMFDEEVCVENNKLIIQVIIKVTEVVHYEDESMYFNGFQIPQTQISLMDRIFMKHPKLAEGFKPKNQLVKTAYMNVLIGIIETVKKHSWSLSLTEVNNAYNDLTELTEAGFKLEWLKSKLDKIMKKPYDVDESQVEECVEMVNKETSDAVVGDRVRKLEERVNSLEMVNKLDIIKTGIEDDNVSAVQHLEGRVKNLELKKKDFDIQCLKSQLADDANYSRVRELEERFKNLELIVKDLKVELDNKKFKSSDDEFLLVN